METINRKRLIKAGALLTYGPLAAAVVGPVLVILVGFFISYDDYGPLLLGVLLSIVGFIAGLLFFTIQTGHYIEDKQLCWATAGTLLLSIVFFVVIPPLGVLMLLGNMFVPLVATNTIQKKHARMYPPNNTPHR